MTVGDIARDRVVTASPDTTVKSAVESMDEHEVGCLVIEQHEDPIGLVTDRKIAMQLKDTPDLATHQVKEFMTTGLVTLDETQGVKEAIDTMSDAGIRRAPVVDDDDELSGIVSVDDVAVLLSEEIDELTGVVEAQSPRF